MWKYIGMTIISAKNTYKENIYKVRSVGKKKSSDTMEEQIQAGNIEGLQQYLGISFKNPEILINALRHRSYVFEASGQGLSSNERLEFLGDSILSFVCAEYLYATYGEMTEGELTDLRAIAVRTSTLAKFAREIHLGDFLLLGKGEHSSGGGQRDSLLASSFEAVLGAVYLDAGITKVREFLLERIKAVTAKYAVARQFKDNKSLLQELAQANIGITPTYQIVEESGPSHNREFIVAVLFEKEVIATGQGKSKQRAEQLAARLALEARGWSK